MAVLHNDVYLGTYEGDLHIVRELYKPAKEGNGEELLQGVSTNNKTKSKSSTSGRITPNLENSSDVSLLVS